MEKGKIGQKLADSGKVIGGALYKMKEKTVQIIDQNDDGQFDMKDVSSMAEKTGEVMKKTVSSVKDALNDKAKEIEKSILQPIFEDDLDTASFAIGKFIRVCGRDKKRAESEVCQGAIGYYSEVQDFKFINIYEDKVDLFNISLYPDSMSELYYVNPVDRDEYIALDDYFGYLKVARISELQKLAQDLGATHFRVTFKEEKASFSHETKGIAVDSSYGKESVEIDLEKNQYSSAEIAAEMEFAGHDPISPSLKYLQRDTNIQNLIEMRMNPTGPLHHQKISISLKNSSGIKERDAAKIDAALKGIKLKGNATLSNEVMNESRRVLEYEIDF